MSIKQVNPYLMFNGTAAEAIRHYERALGAKPVQVPAETNTHVSLDFDDVADMERKFDALAAGGTVTVALHDTFWGARFGMLTDAFGIRWMFNSQTEKKA